MQRILPFLILAFLVFWTSFGCTRWKQENDKDAILGEIKAIKTNIINLPRQIKKNDLDGILRIESRRGNIASCGTAFVLRYNERDLICTAYHVISEGGDVSFFDDSNISLGVTIKQKLVNKGSDTAIFIVENLPKNIKRWELGEIKVNSNLKFIGYPGAKVKKMSEGEALSIVIYSSAIIESGMSGGIIVNEGKAVGIITNQIISSDGLKGSCGAKLEEALNIRPLAK